MAITCGTCQAGTLELLAESDLHEFVCTRCGEIWIPCPRCGQGWVFHLRASNATTDVYSCEECDAMWPTRASISATTWMDFVTEFGLLTPEAFAREWTHVRHFLGDAH